MCHRLKSGTATAETPVIHLSAREQTSQAQIEGLELGADAYLLQPVDPEVLVATIRSLLRTAEATRKLQESEERYRDLASQFRHLLDGIPDQICYIDRDYRIVWVNASIEKALGLNTDQLVGRTCFKVLAGRKSPCDDCPGRAALETGRESVIYQEMTAGSTWELRAVPTKNDIGEVVGVIEIRRDITEHRRTEDRLRQAEKLEAVGQLAGGVAHDFNNLLSVILSLSQLVGHKLGEDHPLSEPVRQIQKAAERSADITGQLLAFARRQVSRPRPLDLNQLITENLTMLRRLVREDIDLSFDPADNLPALHFDPTQISQVLINLVVNARDAIAENRLRDNPAIRIATALKQTEGEPAMIELTVTDNGSGIPNDIREKIFDPFFSTKGGGHGSGLGLATVYGIVDQGGGRVEVDSTPGQGSRFHILLPAGTDQPLPQQDKISVDSDLRGQETLLVVDDEEQILVAARTLLEEAGYRILTSTSPGEALTLLEQNQGIALLLSDVIMPEMPGPELVRRAREKRPDLKVALMSGYVDPKIFDRMRIDWNQLLVKPFTGERLLRKVRRTLDAP
ncbi:MAG: hypothetical protein Tsb0017_18030 [Geothermobacteraceae bacterium]